MPQALPTPGPRVSLFRSCYLPCRASGSFRTSVPLLLPSAQLLFSFRASGTPHPHPRVSYYTPSARQVPPTPIIRASATILPSARQVSARQVRPSVRHPPLPIRASALPRGVSYSPSRASGPDPRVSYSPTVRASSAARQLLSHLRQPFRTSSASLFALPCVRYRLTRSTIPSSAHQAPPIPIRGYPPIPTPVSPRVPSASPDPIYYPLFRASGTA